MILVHPTCIAGYDEFILHSVIGLNVIFIGVSAFCLMQGIRKKLTEISCYSPYLIGLLTTVMFLLLSLFAAYR